MLTLLLAATLAAPTPSIPTRDRGVPIGQGTERPTITLTSPLGGWSVARMIKVEGVVSDPTVNPVEVSINGDRYLLRTHSGRFSRELPAASGRNVLRLRATNRGGEAAAEVTCFARIPPVALKVVLTSDTDGVYTDLHVYEPVDRSGGEKLDVRKMAHVFWANTVSPSGGTFYLNAQGDSFDDPGYGPYLYVHRAPPAGVYAIATNYWPAGDKGHTVATLDLKLFEGTPSEVRRRVRAPLATQGTTLILAWVNVLGEGRAMVYVPGQDPPPSGATWPGNLEEAARALGGRSSEE